MKATLLLALASLASAFAPLLKVETLGLTLFQSFFDNLTTNFINPLIMTLTERPPVDLYMNQPLDLVDFMNITFNVTNFRFTKSELNPKGPIIQLGDNYALFSINELSLDVEFDYQYISDPPIFADIGVGYLGIEGMTLEFTMTTQMDSDFEIFITDLWMDFDPDQPQPLFDGISDFSQMGSNIMTTIWAIIRNRLQSLINAQLLTPQVN
jgi:hypothetical protein